MKISDVLWRAANEHLTLYEDMYSCNAMQDAWDASSTRTAADRKTIDKIYSFLEELGCDTGKVDLFCGFKSGPERQGARYAWLIFASMYAEELGL